MVDSTSPESVGPSRGRDSNRRQMYQDFLANTEHFVQVFPTLQEGVSSTTQGKSLTAAENHNSKQCLCYLTYVHVLRNRLLVLCHSTRMMGCCSHSNLVLVSCPGVSQQWSKEGVLRVRKSCDLLT